MRLYYNPNGGRYNTHSFLRKNDSFEMHEGLSTLFLHWNGVQPCFEKKSKFSPCLVDWTISSYLAFIGSNRA